MGQFAVWGGSLLSWIAVVLIYSAIGQQPAPKGGTQVARVKLPAAWPARLQQSWQVDVGQGSSAPVAVDGKIYVFSRRGEDESLECLSLADGKQVWHQSYPAPYEVNPAAATQGKGPKSTPVVAGGRVFTFGISGILSCWDAKTGKLRWRREFSKQFGKTSPLNGVAMSPAVYEDKCIVHVGGPDKGALLALNVKNGETLWSASEDGPGYASPLVCTLNDERQVVALSQKACLGVDIENGKVLWTIPFQAEYDQNVVTPLVHEGTLIFSGINKGVERYRVESSDDEWETDKIWENKEVSTSMSTPVCDGERLFGFSHRQKGQLFAIDLTTGKTLWTSDGRLGESAALMAAGKVLWALTTQGDLIVFKASDKQFEQLAHYKVADTATWAQPVVLAGGVLVKDESKLTLWQLPKDR